MKLFKIGVKLIEVIEFSCLAVKNVNDDRCVINDAPAAVVASLGAEGLNAALSDAELHLVDECLDLRGGVTRADDEPIGNDGLLLNLDGELFLLVERQIIY